MPDPLHNDNGCPIGGCHECTGPGDPGAAGTRGHPTGRRARSGAQASALAFNWSNSAGVMVPASSSVLASAMCSAGDAPPAVTCWM